MKKIIVVLFAAVLLCSCKDNKAEVTAEGFLTSYLAMDYEGAAVYCDSLVANHLRRSTNGWQALDTTLRAKIKEAASTTRFEITSVDDETEKGKAHIKYLLYPMGNEKGHEMNMTLTKENGKWLVSGLN